MKLEHTAFPVQDPVQVANWYVEHLGMRIVRQTGAPTHTHFLADEAGSVFEIYNNPQVAVPDYLRMHPLLLHLAFGVDDMRATWNRLVAVGASVVEKPTPMPNGDILCMLRDPWGLALQLVKRHEPLV